MAKYLSVSDVIAIHDAMMIKSGYPPAGLRDENLLASALARGQTAAYYENADLISQSVLMAIGISMNQPFVDGNKRAGFAVMDIFLMMNGLQFIGDPLEMALHLERIAEASDQREVRMNELEDWLRQQVITRNT